MKILKQPPPPNHGPQGENLIQCGDDGWRPWSIVCRHLGSGDSREWVPIESTNPYVQYDWLCPECVAEKETLERHGTVKRMLSKLTAACVLCVERLRKKFDPNYEGDIARN